MNMVPNSLLLSSVFYASVWPMLMAYAPDCHLKSPIDITGSQGVKTEKIPGSRVQYHPLPYAPIREGDTITLEFATASPTGLIFAAGDFEKSDIVAAFMHKGYLTFARQCGFGRVFEVFREKLDDGKWHSVIFVHTHKGGEMMVDGYSHFRRYQLGPCSNFNSIFLGGFPPQMDLERWTVRDDTPHIFRNLNGTRHRFEGCIRNLRIGEKRPNIAPHYFAVSECDTF